MQPNANSCRWLALIVLLTPLIAGAQQPVFIPKRLGAKKTVALDSNGWTSTGIFVLNINQSAQADWGSGGEKFMFGINGIVNKAIHHKKNKYSFDLYADIELGLVKASSFSKPRKTTDRLDITAEIEHSIGKKGHWNYALLGNINTQFFKGHNYFLPGEPLISGFLSPGKFLLATGFDYKYVSPKSYFSVFLSPSTVRWVTKIEPSFLSSKRFGVDADQKVNTEFGAYVSFHFNTRFTPSTHLISRLDVYSNYLRKPGNMDILFNNVLTLGINKFLAGTLLFDILYDHDFKQRTQVQEITGIGLRLKL